MIRTHSTLREAESWPPVGPSRLTDHQAQEVRTEPFQAWFGDWEQAPSEASAIVGEEGRPLVVFHATLMPYAFDRFAARQAPNTRRYTEETGEEWVAARDETAYMGSHFTASIYAAERILEKVSRSGYPNIYPVYLNLRCPFCATEGRLHQLAFREPLSDPWPDMLASRAKAGDPQTFRRRYERDESFRAEENWRAAFQQEENGETGIVRRLGRSLQRRLETRGFDGVIYDNHEEGGVGYIAFRPEQIKSAIANDGSFDDDDPNMLS